MIGLHGLFKPLRGQASRPTIHESGREYPKVFEVCHTRGQTLRVWYRSEVMFLENT